MINLKKYEQYLLMIFAFPLACAIVYLGFKIGIFIGGLLK